MQPSPGPTAPAPHAPASLREPLQAAALVLLVVPWVNPFAPGPSPGLMPWLVTGVCAGLLLLLAPVIGARLVAQAWLTAALLSAGAGLLQYGGGAAAFFPWINQTALGETFGNLRQRNQFASLMGIGMAALVWQVARSEPGRRGRGLAIAAAALLGAADAASASRTGLLQIVLLALLCLLWGRWRQPAVRDVVLAVVAAYAAAVCLLPLWIGLTPATHGVFARMADDSVPCSSRLVLWRNVLQLIAERPWTGWGWGELDYAHFATLYPGDRFCAILDNAHNLPLHLAVELGVPAALLLCGAALWLIVRAQPWREARPIAQLAWTVLVFIGAHSLLEYPLWYGPFMTAAVLCVLMLAGVLADEPAPRSPWRFGGAALLLAALAYVAWDYHRVSQIYTPPAARAPAYRDNTLAKVRASWLFADQVRFAELTLSPVSRANAPAMHALASQAIHYSPEPAVIERLIESAVMLGLDDEALVNLARYKAAFPQEHAAWAAANLRAVQKGP
jgi:O-antigen ligase